MREIKFRVWDLVNKSFSRHPTFISDEGNLYGDRDPNGVNMSGAKSIIFKSQYIFAGQYTGLKDKNGKEIYFDSDIIKIPDYIYDEKWGVGFKRHKADLIFIVEENFFGNRIKILSPANLDHVSLSVLFNHNSAYSHLNYPMKMEIIGNIHSNPELL